MTRHLLILMLSLAAASAHAQALPSASAAKPAAAKPPSAAKGPAAGPNEAASPEEIFAEWDTDKSKQLSVAEFKAGVEKARMQEVLARLEQQFLKADTNKSKKIEPGEYAQLPAIKRGVQQTLEGKPALLEFITQKETMISSYGRD